MKREESALIIEMDDTTYVEMLKKGKINIGWRKCHIADYVNVKRCFNCWGFYHIAKNCTRPISCAKCAGDHKISDCKAEKEKCINYMYKNKTYNLKINEEHSALSRKLSDTQEGYQRGKEENWMRKRWLQDKDEEIMYTNAQS